MMLKNISLGIYIPGSSLLHRLQARTKWLLLALIVLWLTIANQRIWHFLPFGVLALLLCCAIACSGVSLREIWRRTWLLVVLTLIGLLTVLFTTSGDTDIILASFGPLHTTYGLVQNILLVSVGISIALSMLCSLPIPTLQQIRRRRWIRYVRLLLVLIALGGLFWLWLIAGNPENATLLIGPLIISQSGVWSLMSVVAALLTLFIFSQILLFTTSPVALIEGLSMLLSPLRRLKLPVDDFALMTLIALRFIPTLLEEIELLAKAQAARGADLTSGTLRDRIYSLVIMFVPLMNSVFRRASELSTALEARGYEVEGSQTPLYETTMGIADYALIAAVVLICAASLIP